jgi:hypothetical protein
MTNSPMPTAPTPAYILGPPTKKPHPRWVKVTLLTVGGIVLLLIGVGIGAAGSSQTSLVNSQKAQIARLQSQMVTAKSNLSAEQSKLSIAQADAQDALSTARAQVKAQYKAKFATLQTQEQKVAGLQAKLNRELGVVAKSTISEDGVYVVGKDIPSGVYHTTGAPGGGSPGGQCYYATLGSTDTSNILDNNNFNGPETVDISGAYAFQISGGCTWRRE